MRKDERRQEGSVRHALVPSGDVRRWSEREKRALVRYIREQQQATGRLTIVSELAKELGISPSAIYGWMRWHRDGGKSERQIPVVGSGPERREVGFVEVAVVPCESAVVAFRPIVVSPSGYRVEGLDLAGVVTVLKALS
jgi:transposase-like protein